MLVPKCFIVLVPGIAEEQLPSGVVDGKRIWPAKVWLQQDGGVCTYYDEKTWNQTCHIWLSIPTYLVDIIFNENCD